MKKRILIGTLLGITALLGVFYACKKNEETSVSKTEFVAATQSSQRTSGRIIYYSKNEGDTVYKMVLTTNESGIVSVERSIYNTNRTDTFKVKVYYDNVELTGFVFNPDSNLYYADTIKIKVPINKTYYVIPFNPTKMPEERFNSNGVIEYYCQCGCISSAVCDYCVQNGNGASSSCPSVCDICNLVASCGDLISTGKVSKVGGMVLIEANGVNVVN